MPLSTKDLNSEVKFIFVGTLVKGKKPLYAIQIVESLLKKGVNVSLRLYGEGAGKKELVDYVLKKELESLISFEGNQSKEIMSRFVLSPMPGLLVNVAVVPGQKVRAGERVAVIEAMKMENVLFATADGVVGKVLASKGESLAVDQAIVEFE